MDSARWQQVQSIFHDVADHPACERPTLLQKLCHHDASLIVDVARMLEEDERSESMLDGDLSSLAHQLMDDADMPIPSEKFGPYRIKELLGEGGMGVVWLAERDDLGSQAAIKILQNAALSPSRRRLFASEQRNLAQLNHPFIARLYDADTLADGTPYFVMEYVEGVNLARYCSERKPSVEQLLQLFRSVCEAVRYAHGQAIIHRDLKPSNIFVKDDGGVKLLDFGIAKRIAELKGQPGQQKTGRLLMTPAYAAPEQVRGESIGTQADVYSLGVILYQLLAGQLPYEPSDQSRWRSERTPEPAEAAPPSVVAKQASTHLRINNADWRELDVLCLHAIHTDVGKRYPSVEALIRDIDHYLKQEPLEARPDSFLYRTNKFVSRHRWGLLQTTLILAVILGGVAFFTLRLARERARTLAEVSRTQRIQNFMLTLFDGGDKQAGPSDSLRVTMLLDRGVQEAHAFNGDPQTQAELYLTLAKINQKLGKFDRAEPLLRSALELKKTELGASNPAVAETMIALGLLRADQAQLPDAEQIVRAALEIDRRDLPSNDPATARAMSALGRVLEERGAYNDAISLLNDTVQIQSRQLPATSDLADSLSELANAQYYVGHYEIADSLNRRALAINTQVYGTTHPRIADNLVDLGEIQHDLGHDAEAEKYYRQALDIKKSWYGEVHPDTATCMAAVGQSLVYQGRYDEAAPLLNRALEIQEQIYGKMHPQVAIALNQVGVLELRRKHMDAALADFQRMADINRSAYGDRHLLVGVALVNVAQVYFEKNNLTEAEHFFREALARFIEQLPPGHQSIAIAQVKLGKTLVLEHRYREAEGHLLLGYTALGKMNPPPVERLWSTRKDLVTVYEALREQAKADEYRGELPIVSVNTSSKEHTQ